MTSSIYLFPADVSRICDMLHATRYDGRYYDVVPNLSLKEVKRQLDNCSVGTRIRADLFSRGNPCVKQYELWFSVCILRPNSQMLRNSVHFDGDTIFFHGADKDGPWCKLVFCPLRENASMPIIALEQAYTMMHKEQCT